MRWGERRQLKLLCVAAARWDGAAGSTSSLPGSVGYRMAGRSPDTVRCRMAGRSQDREASEHVWAPGSKFCLPTWPTYEVGVDLFISGMCLVYIHMISPVLGPRGDICHPSTHAVPFSISGK